MSLKLMKRIRRMSYKNVSNRIKISQEAIWSGGSFLDVSRSIINQITSTIETITYWDNIRSYDF